MFQQVQLKKVQHQDSNGGGSEGGNKTSKVPLLPPSGRPGAVKAETTVSKQVVESRPHPLVAKAPGKENTRAHPNATPDSSLPSTSQDKTRGGLGGEIKKTVRNFTSAISKGKHGAKTPNHPTTNSNVSKKNPLDGRKRANSADKATPKPEVGGVSSAGGSPRRPRVPVQLLKDVVPSKPPSSKNTPPSSLPQRVKPSSYENVDLTEASPAGLQPLSPVDDTAYENLSFTNKHDSEVYENFGIGFAGIDGNLTGPLPPLPPTRHPIQQARRTSYENVTLGKKAKEMTTVEEDDDTLFGKEGPPGMQQQETIYENFGSDKANRLMTIEELAAHVEKLGKKGLSTEYYRIRNEPITAAHTTCK